MSEPLRGNPPSTKPEGDRLDSWKEIAAYVGRDVTTVQRWEKRERMPVHRHVHDRLGSVYAYRADLDAWLRSRHVPAPAADEPVSPLAAPVAPLPPAVPRTSVRKPRFVIVAAGAALALAAIAALSWLRATDSFWRSPIAGARFERITDFDGVAQAAALSRDGRFVAFLSRRDEPTDVWVTQIGSGQFHNLTHGTAAELLNPP